MKTELLKIINNFKGKKILVIGDVMLDKYIWGSVTRISPEAPVQVVEVEKESYALGGAANTANNIAALQGDASIIGLAGDDAANKQLLEELKRRNIKSEGIIIRKNRQTIQKVRIMAQNQQLMRVDYEDKDRITEETEKKIIEMLKSKISYIDGIIISDYFKGLITKKLVENINSIAKQNNKFLVVDPKPANALFYKNVDLITPNQKEAAGILSLDPEETKDDSSIKRMGVDIMKLLNCNVIITRGEHGMALFEKTGEITNIPTKAKEVYDVSGAGDTVVALLALSLAAGADIKEAAQIANYAAGIVVGKLGTATTTINELKYAIENEKIS